MIRYFCKISDLNTWSSGLQKEKKKSVSLSVVRYLLLRAFSLMDRYEKYRDGACTVSTGEKENAILRVIAPPRVW